MDMVIFNRIKENAVLIQRECIKILSIIRNDLFIKFEQQDNNICSESLENDMITNNILYKNLETKYNDLACTNETMKHTIIKLIHKEKDYKNKIRKLIMLIDILNKKYNAAVNNKNINNTINKNNSATVINTKIMDLPSDIVKNKDQVIDPNLNLDSDLGFDSSLTPDTDLHLDYSMNNDDNTYSVNHVNVTNIDIVNDDDNDNNIDTASKISTDLQSLFST